MLNLDLLYNLREKIPKNVRKIFPKILRRKINKKFFKYYYLPSNLKNLPSINYPDEENFEFQENLIKKFAINQKQSSFMTFPNLINLLITKFEKNKNFKFLDVGGERIDFYLDLKKNFKNIEYFLHNQESMLKPFYAIKNKYDYKDLYLIDKIDKTFDKNFDFVNFGSSIQYFNNYDELLKKITNNCKYIFFSGTHLFDTSKKKFEKNLIVKQVNLLPKTFFLYFLNRKMFFEIFYEKNFELAFEEQNLTENINYDNFRSYLQNIKYSDFLFEKK